MAHVRLTKAKAIEWLRQKSRTETNASPTSPDNGEWTDVDIIRELNTATRAVVNKLLAMPWSGYFIKRIAGVTVNKKITVGAGGVQYGVIKPAWVKWTAGDTNNAFASGLSVNRLVHAANAARDGSADMGSNPMVLCTLEGHAEAVPDPGFVLEFFNVVGEQTVEIGAYVYPEPLTEDAAAQNIGLPPQAHNMLLGYTLWLMTMDELNVELHAWAEQFWKDELVAVLTGAPLSFDMPDPQPSPAPMEARSA